MPCNDSLAIPSSSKWGVMAASAASCILSIAGAIFIIITYTIIPEIRNTTRKLVTVLAVADLLTPLGYLSTVIHTAITHSIDSGKFCTAQSAVTTYSSMVSFYLTVLIGIHLFWTLLSQSTGTGSTIFMVVAMVICWGAPGIIIGVALSEGMLGKSDANSTVGTGPWCWIICQDNRTSQWEKTKFYMFFTGKGWEVMCYVFTAGFYLLLKFQMYLRYRFRTLGNINLNLRDDDQNFLYVWLVLITIRIWGTIRFFLVTVNDNPISSSRFQTFEIILVYLQAIGDPSQAFCNSILFCLLDRSVRGKLANVCSSLSGARNYENISDDLRSNDSSIGEDENINCSSGDDTHDEDDGDATIRFGVTVEGHAKTWHTHVSDNSNETITERTPINSKRTRSADRLATRKYQSC